MPKSFFDLEENVTLSDIWRQKKMFILKTPIILENRHDMDFKKYSGLKNTDFIKDFLQPQSS